MNNQIVRILLAVLLGEIALIALTTLVQEVMYDGISYTNSSLFDLTTGGFATVIAAVLAGAIACLVSNSKNILPPIIISLLVLIETSYLISSGKTVDPLWFDAFAGLMLAIGIWMGYFFVNLFRRNTASVEN